jgi:hypothetical protein
MWWSNPKPKPVPIDYIGLMEEATEIQRRVGRLAARAEEVFTYGSIRQLDEINAAIETEQKRLYEIALEVGATNA